MTILQAQNLCFQYSQSSQPVLDQVSLALEPGHFLAIIGPNGAAKSTLLRILSGIAKPSSGQLTVLGQDDQDYTPTERARVVAYVPQHASVPFDFSALEVVLMGRHPHNRGQALWTKTQDRELALQALKDVDALPFADRIFNQLSGGERQRVIVARALCQSRQCLVLDEPTSAQDLHHQLLVLETLKTISASGAVVLATHKLSLAVQFATHVLVLNKGQVHSYGPTREVMTEQLFSEVFQVSGSFQSLPSGVKVLIPTRREGEQS